MFDYSERIDCFRDKKVRLSAKLLEKLFAHRKANRDRLISRLPDQIEGLTIGEPSFRPQGSSAMQTIIQTRFAEEEYDIDDGLVLWHRQLVKQDGTELTADEVKQKVREALKDPRFSRQPRICSNCVRVFYADADEEKHHVDFPVYRGWEKENGDSLRELAGESGWTPSDPTQVNVWFEDLIKSRNAATGGWGSQLRQLIQLIKRFCRSRPDTEWDIPNGMKLTMLVAECQPSHNVRIDCAFRAMLERLKNRLAFDKVIRNLAHPDRPAITKTLSDNNIVEFLEHIEEAISQLLPLDKSDNDNEESARRAWDWIFKSDGFFKEFDAQKREKDKKDALMAKVVQIGQGAKTSPLGVIGPVGVANMAHKFYGDSPNP
jgi:hypothetical protein